MTPVIRAWHLSAGMKWEVFVVARGDSDKECEEQPQDTAPWIYLGWEGEEQTKCGILCQFEKITAQSHHKGPQGALTAPATRPFCRSACPGLCFFLVRGHFLAWQ